MSGPARDFKLTHEDIAAATPGLPPGVPVTGTAVWFVRYLAQPILRDVTFRVFARPELLLKGVSCQGMASVRPQKNGSIRASLFFTEEVLEDLLIHFKPQMEWTHDEYRRAWEALHIVRHECAHVLQRGTFADLYKKYFAPYGLHEQEQFANALSCVLGTRPDTLDTYHPPTRRQVEELQSHLAYGTHDRLATPRSIVAAQAGSWSMQFFAPIAVCTFCGDTNADLAA